MPIPDKARQTPLEQLQEMNERVGQSRKRSARPRDPTKKVERWYRAQLRSLVRAMSKRVKEEVLPVIKEEKAEYRQGTGDSAPLDRVERAAKQTECAPSFAQIETGNYRKGRCALHGLLLTIENPRGSVRTGVDADGHRWERKMPHHYGYIRRTEGNDGDAVDAFVGPEPDSPKAFIVDQRDPHTDKFDEHKIMLGFTDIEAARKGYLDAYERGWTGLAEITEVSLKELRAWLNRGNMDRPAAGSIPRTLTTDSVPTMDAWSDRVIQAIQAVSAEFISGIFAQQYERIANQAVSLAESESTQAFVESVNQAVGVDMSKMIDNEGLQEYTEAAAYQNAQLVKNIPEKYFTGIENAVLGGVRGGDAPTTIAKKITEQTGIAGRRANEIARDQTAKLTGEITERRQRQSGIRYFQWITSKDERVGDDHRRAAKRDVGYGPGVYRWDKPPKEGVPGNSTRPNCRCTARPVFEWELPEKARK